MTLSRASLRQTAIRLLETLEPALAEAPLDAEHALALRPCGDGLSRSFYRLDLLDSSSGSGRLRCYGLWLPRRDAPCGAADRLRQEVKILNLLSAHDLPFATPRVLAVEEGPDGPIVLREYFAGSVLADALESAAGADVCRTVGRLAAEVHRGSESIGADAEIERKERSEEMAWNRARARCAGRKELRDLETKLDMLRFGTGRIALLHGDLLPQNILRLDDERSSKRFALIDWEYSRYGDPAYDLAIATRAEDRPFGVDDGLDLLLENYRSAGGFPVERDAVRFYQLCLAAEWFHHARESEDPSESEAEAIERIRRLIDA